MDALVPVVVGGLLALVGGLLGAWIQGRREHKRWVREQRFQAYQRALRFVERVRAFGDDDLIADFVAEQMPEESSERDDMLERMRARLGEAERPAEDIRALRALGAERFEVTTLIALVGPSDVATHLSATVAALDRDDDEYFRPSKACSVRCGSLWAS